VEETYKVDCVIEGAVLSDSAKEGRVSRRTDKGEKKRHEPDESWSVVRIGVDTGSGEGQNGK
jgi:hypothetical protein